MIIGKIEDGIVLDHIKAGRGMELYRILGLDNLDCQVALIKNADSGKMLAPLQFGRIEFGACDGRKRCRSLNRRGSNFFKHGARHGRVVQCGAGVSGFGIAKKIKLHFVGFGCDVG